MNPRLIKALEEMNNGNPGPLLAITMKSRNDVCRCENPDVEGLALMCRECLYRNQEQERRAEEAIRQPHSFEPGGKLGLCNRYTGVGNLTCLRPEEHEWHVEARND